MTQWKKDLKSQQTKNEICVEICVHANTNSKRLEYKNIFVFFLSRWVWRLKGEVLVQEHFDWTLNIYKEADLKTGLAVSFTKLEHLLIKYK